MELSREVQSGLTFAGDTSSVQDSTFDHAVETVFRELKSDSHQRSAKSSEDSCEGTPSVIKCVVSALAHVAVESAKLDLSTESIREVLEDCQIESNRISIFLKAFESSRSTLQKSLSRIESLAVSSIVDVDWRLDYIVRSNHNEKINELSYLVCLKVKEPDSDEIRDVRMNCSVEQMQDLVGKLRDAVKCVKKQAG